MLLGAMTREEKIGLLTGTAAPRVGIPPVKFTDGGLGAGGLGAGFGEATAMPAGMALAAGWDSAMAREYGTVVGNEVKNRGFDGVFGPTVNIMRTPLGGRTFEAYGEDPYLAARMASGWILGAQAEGVMADAKHYAANNQEGQLGVPPVQGILGGRLLTNAIVDERTLREIYFPAFEAAVTESRTATVMCSYNRLNGIYACENHFLLEKVLRGWGFDGFVVSDFGAAHNTAANLNNGMDYDIGSTAYLPLLVEIALASGSVSAETLDERVRTILRTLFAIGFFDRPSFQNDAAQIDQLRHAEVARTVAEQGITLLKNTGVLPLDPSELRSIAVIGSAAGRYVRGRGSSQVTPFHTVTALEGIRERAGSKVSVRYNDGLLPLLAAVDAAAADVAIVVVADTETEGSDKLCMSLDCPGVGLPNFGDATDLQLTVGLQDELIRSVANANPRTIVVLETGAPVLTPWRDQVEALLEAWYPGQEGGTAIARVLFGDIDPGGRLPATFPRHEGDIPTAGDLEKYPGVAENAEYKEGVLVGYRWYDARSIEPAFPFGFGLSYTTFSIHDLRIERDSNGVGARITIEVTNTGNRRGIAVPQLYVGIPSPSPEIVQPPKHLKRFAHLSIVPGSTERATFELESRDLSFWDVSSEDWRVAPGCYAIMVGSSSRDIEQQATVPIGVGSCQ